jgi:hypothetical protein
VYTAGQPEGNLLIAHSSSSQQNPVTITQCLNTLIRFTQFNPSQKEVFSPHARTIRSKAVYDLLFFMTQKLPIHAMATVAKLPIVGSKQMQTKAATFLVLLTRMKEM